jgi:hypothetical protein
MDKKTSAEKDREQRCVCNIVTVTHVPTMRSIHQSSKAIQQTACSHATWRARIGIRCDHILEIPQFPRVDRRSVRERHLIHSAARLPLHWTSYLTLSSLVVVLYLALFQTKIALHCV